MPITTYTDIQDAGFVEGQIYSDAGSTTILSGYNGTASTIIPAGFAVCLDGAGTIEGNTNYPLILPADANSVFMGIAVLPKGVEKVSGTSVDADSRFGFPVDTEVQYMTNGIIAVPVDDTVAINDPVFWRHTATGDERAGMFRMDADTADAVQIGALDTCRFITAATGTAASPAIALIKINIA